MRESKSEIDCIAFTNYRGSCVLIAPNIVLSIQHVPTGCQAEEPYIVRFRRAPDCSVGSYDCPPDDPGGGADSFHDVRVRCWANVRNWPEGDPIVIGFLEQPVLHIRPIPIETNASAVVHGLPVYVAGWGPKHFEVDGSGGVTYFEYGSLRVGDMSLSVFQGAYSASITGDHPGLLRDSGGPWLAETGPGDALRVVSVFRTSNTGPLLHRYVSENAIFQVFTNQGSCEDPANDAWDYNCPNCMDDEDYTVPEYIECFGDANRDNTVDIMDMNMVLGNFGAGCLGDVNYNMAVDIADLNMVIANFNSVCTVPGSLDFAACESQGAAPVGQGPDAPEWIDPVEAEFVLAELGWNDISEYGLWVAGLSPADRETHCYELLATYWLLFGPPE